MPIYDKSKFRKGRGATFNPSIRFHQQIKESLQVSDQDGQIEEISELRCSYIEDFSKTIINYNQSPDIPFDRSINPYRGCEHGCVYCFARPTHAYLDCSPGLDFETRIFYKANAVQLLEQELAKASYRCQPVAIGMNTDAYQAIDKKLRLTRDIIKLLLAAKHPFTLLTKSALIERDIDLLVQAAKLNLVSVGISVTSLDADLSRAMEPRASVPKLRLRTIEILSRNNIPVNVLMAPVIPFINDAEIEQVLKAVKSAGALNAGMVMLRLPHELKELFSDWLAVHFPQKAKRVLNRIRDMRGGELYRSEFVSRQTGQGVYADLIQQRFQKTVQKYQLNQSIELCCNLFEKPGIENSQMKLDL